MGENPDWIARRPIFADRLGHVEPYMLWVVVPLRPEAHGTH